MSSGIYWDTTVQRQLASRGVDESTGVYGQHKVQIGKGSPIRLDEIKSASIPYAGFSTMKKIERGKAGVQQCAGDVLKTLAKPGTLDAKPLLGSLKAMQTHYERLDKLGQLSEAQQESMAWMFTSKIQSLTNEELAAVFQSFTSSEMDLLQTALQREAQINQQAADAAHAAEALFDMQALVIREISNRSINAQIDDMVAADASKAGEAEAMRPQSLTDAHGGQAAGGIHDPAGQHGMSAYSLHTLAEAASGSSTQREKNAVAEASKLSLRKLDNVAVKQMGDVLRGAELTINIKTEYLIGGANSIFDHPNDPMVNLFHLHEQGIEPLGKGEAYRSERDTVEKEMFPALKGHAIRADERPMYGALNVDRRRGGALGERSGYGASAIVLKPHVARRATYTLDDSFMSGKISITPERKQNFYRLLDGSKLPQAAIEALKDPNSKERRNFDAFLDTLPVKSDACIRYFTSNVLPGGIVNLLSDPGNDQYVTDSNLDRFKDLCIQCFSDSEATQGAMATYDNIENLVTQMSDFDGNALALAAQKKASGQKPHATLGHAQYIEAQIHGPIIPSRDIAEIRISMDDVDDDEKAALREQAKAYEKTTGIKVTLMENFLEMADQDDTVVEQIQKEEIRFNTAHMDMAALEALKQEYLRNITAKIQEYLRLFPENGCPEGALRLEGNALQSFASKFLEKVDETLANPKGLYRNHREFLNGVFTDTLRPMIQHKAELLRELETLAGNEPPMTAAQKEAVTKWVVSAKALRSPEELRMIIRNARAQESLLREIAAADPPLTPEQILQRQSALVKNADADLAAFLRNSGLAKEFLQDELTNEQDRMSFMGIALLQNGDPPMDQAALQDLFARIGGPGMKNLTDQLESVIDDVAGGGHESLDAHHLSMIQQQLMLNAHNLGRQIGQNFALNARAFEGELSLLQEPLRAALRETVPDLAQKLDDEHPPYAPMPAPANPQAMPQDEAQRRAFCVKAMDSYIPIEKVHEKGRSTHGRGHIARSYIYANAMCNMLEEAGIK
ncbi:MAG: DUF3626 domain-containing protein, partial [Mailhella sp.]|nr:DUF3626 domain-containing protein [Mailhella sp.]